MYSRLSIGFWWFLYIIERQTVRSPNLFKVLEQPQVLDKSRTTLDDPNVVVDLSSNTWLVHIETPHMFICFKESVSRVWVDRILGFCKELFSAKKLQLRSSKPVVIRQIREECFFFPYDKRPVGTTSSQKVTYSRIHSGIWTINWKFVKDETIFGASSTRSTMD